MNFKNLVDIIRETNHSLRQDAVKAINRHLTIRNWLIGFYIFEFEQLGEDRAGYGERLLPELAGSFREKGISVTLLKTCRQFYLAYPQISSVVADFLYTFKFNFIRIGQTLSDQFQINDNQSFVEHDTLLRSEGYSNQNEKLMAPEELVLSLSFSHFLLLIPVEDRNKRSFYELECMKGNWSVRELRRQINTLFYERCAISQNPQKLKQLVHEAGEKTAMNDIIKSPFTFEFLGLKAKDIVYEDDLEQALTNHLEEFLIELGHGFCFEAKQKRIIIGGEYFFIDLVFYHRILKCHVLVEIKTKEVKHEHIGQLKTYINYYKKEVMLPGDNPPVGILLVTEKNKALVEYAIADADQQIFVSRYLVELPPREALENFILRELKTF